MTRRIALILIMSLFVATACTATTLPEQSAADGPVDTPLESALQEAQLQEAQLQEAQLQGSQLQEDQFRNSGGLREGPSLDCNVEVGGPAGGETTLNAGEAQQEGVKDSTLVQEGAVEKIQLVHGGEVIITEAGQTAPTIDYEELEEMLDSVNRGGPPLPEGDSPVVGPEPGTETGPGGGETLPVPSSSTGKIIIRTVSIPEIPGQETGTYIEIGNEESEAIQLCGWILEDGDGHMLEFPDYVILPGESCRIYRDESHLEWCGLTIDDLSPFWASTEGCLVLRDASGTKIDEFCYP